MKENGVNQTMVNETGPVTTGWCPYHDAPFYKKSGLSIMDLFTSGKNPKTPDNLIKDLEYSHQQVGIVQLWAGILALIIILIAAFFLQDIIIVFIIPMLALIIGIGLFSTLNVEITIDAIKLQFGPIPVIKRRFPFEMITSYKLVKNPWYYGYGIRWVPNGVLYNISGPDALELTLSTGKKVQIGTDEPKFLLEVFKKVTHHSIFPKLTE